jgi:hypothetical protein
MDKMTKIIRDMIIKELNLPSDELQEHIRIELYKKLQEIAPNIKLQRDSLVLNLSGLNEILSRYGYRLQQENISIPLVRKFGRGGAAPIDYISRRGVVAPPLLAQKI